MVEHYRVFVGSDGYLRVRYEDDWEVIEEPILDLLGAFVIARRRSPDWVIEDARGMRTRYYRPKKHLALVPKENPFYLSIKPEGKGTQRMGPMSEADFWIEDLEELQPLQTSADPTFEEIGQLLRDRRLELGMTQRKVASMSDISPSTMHDIEQGNIRSTHERLNRVAKILGAYFEGPLPSRLKRNVGASYNPSGEQEEPGMFDEDPDIEHYVFFHGVPPEEIIDMEAWVPGGMVLVGVGKDVGYGISNKHSSKNGWYVHDFGSSVKVYRRAKKGEKATKTWRSFPRQLTNLGYNLGFTYLDGGVDGPMKEVKGSSQKYLGVTPNRRTLVVVGPRGVEYLMEGGNMRVDDWIRD